MDLEEIRRVKLELVEAIDEEHEAASKASSIAQELEDAGVDISEITASW